MITQGVASHIYKKLYLRHHIFNELYHYKQAYALL